MAAEAAPGRVAAQPSQSVVFAQRRTSSGQPGSPAEVALARGAAAGTAKAAGVQAAAAAAASTTARSIVGVVRCLTKSLNSTACTMRGHCGQ
jgi:hypothetical protein